MSKPLSTRVLRRDFLATLVIGSFTFAGCLDALSEDGPEEVAKEMLKAISDPDQEKALELAHRDGPAAATLSGQVIFPQPSTEVNNISTEIIEEEDDRTVVQLDFELDRLGEEPEESTRVYELRTNDDGEWKVWSLQVDDE